MPCTRGLTIITLFGILVGCSNVQSAPSSATVFSRSVESNVIDPISDAGTSRVFIADSANNLIYIYDERGTKLGQIAGISQPGNLATDVDGTLYVVTGNAVDILKKPYHAKPTALQGPADGVAVSISGLVAVLTVISNSGGPGTVSFYRRGARTACNTLAAFARTYFAAFDAAGDLFIDGLDTKNKVVVGEIVGGCEARRARPLTTRNAIDFPGDIAVNVNDQIAIGDQEASAIYTYAQPKNGSLGAPLRTTIFSSADVTSFVFANHGHDFWSVDAGLSRADEFAYPAGGSAIQTLDVGGTPIGIAVTPVVNS